MTFSKILVHFQLLFLGLESSHLIQHLSLRVYWCLIYCRSLQYSVHIFRVSNSYVNSLISFVSITCFFNLSLFLLLLEFVFNVSYPRFEGIPFRISCSIGGHCFSIHLASIIILSFELNVLYSCPYSGENFFLSSEYHLSSKIVFISYFSYNFFLQHSSKRLQFYRSYYIFCCYHVQRFYCFLLFFLLIFINIFFQSLKL